MFLEISQLAQRLQEFEQKDCTFQPTMQTDPILYQKSLHADYSTMNTKSIEKFLERQIVARVNKELVVELQKKSVGSGLNWQNKVTVPRTPKTMKALSSARRGKDDIYSSMMTFGGM